MSDFDIAVSADGILDTGTVFLIKLTSTGHVQSFARLADGEGGFTGTLPADSPFKSFGVGVTSWGRYGVAISGVDNNLFILLAESCPDDPSQNLYVFDNQVPSPRYFQDVSCDPTTATGTVDVRPKHLQTHLFKQPFKHLPETCASTMITVPFSFVCGISGE